MAAELPREILSHIFNLATDEDVLFQWHLPDASAPYAWFKNVFGEWALRPPKEALNLIQRRSYETKKAILRVCKVWRSIGEEFMFKSLFFDNPLHIQAASKRIVASAEQARRDKSTPLGWWTKRIHLVNYGRTISSNQVLEVQDALTKAIRCCRNLEIFISDFPLDNSFGNIVAGLVSYSFQSLRTIHWTVLPKHTSKVILALDALPSLIAVSLEFPPSPPEEEGTTLLGASSALSIELPYLEQLLLKGFTYEFLEQATEWAFPSLKCFAIDTGTQTMEPDIIPFLKNHGLGLMFLSLDCLLSLDVPQILELCPSLSGFTLNADWRLPLPNPQVSSDRRDIHGLFLHRSHGNLRFIGLTGLSNAFGTGFIPADPLRTALIQRNNDRMLTTICKLKNEGFLTKLMCIRALSPSLLASLEKSNGPAEGDAMERWDKWDAMFREAGIRFEDCTGSPLGQLPELDEEEDEDDGDSSEDEFEAPYGTWKSTAGSQSFGGMVGELRKLIEECEALNASREEGLFSEEAAQWIGPDAPLPS